MQYRSIRTWIDVATRAGPSAYIIAVAMAIVARAALGYRSFPSIDDFVYIPLARAHLDGALYSTDLFVQGFVFHFPLLPVLVGLLESTIGLASGLLIVTLVLSVATVLAMLRLMRAFGATGVLLSLAVLIAVCGQLKGLGRGQHDGAFGDAFHMQWLALCLLLWCYDGFVRGRAVVTGVLLGLAAVAHPVVGAHGAAVVGLATLVARDWRWRRLVIAAAVCLLVSSPALVPFAVKLVIAGGAPDFDVVGLGYLFRTPQQFVLKSLSVGIVVVVALCGWAGAIIVCARRWDMGTAGFAGLLLGHSVLAAMAIAAHGPWAEGSWVERVTLLFQVHLTRTTPLLMVLSTIAFAAALERQIADIRTAEWRRFGVVPFWGCAALALILLLVLLLMQVAWHPLLLAVLVLTVVAAPLWHRTPWRTGMVGAWVVVGLVAAGLLVEQTETTANPTQAEQDLYAWARNTTAPEALFIIPPSHQEFRLYTDRGAYVDFKIFPATTTALIPQWRQRLERVAAPDRLALDSTGWPGIVEWDRTYANRNTPRRIADLLRETPADYFVWDSAGLAIPPFVTVERTEDPRLDTVFTNDRFTVYRLAGFDLVHAE